MPASPSSTSRSPHPRPPSPTVPLNLTVRFSHSSIPDISLPLQLPAGRPGAPGHLSVNNLKARLRELLPEDFGKHGLKLIYAGRVLDGRQSVAKALRVDTSSEAVASSAVRSDQDGRNDATPEHVHVAEANLNELQGGVTGKSSKGKGKGKARAWEPVENDSSEQERLLENTAGDMPETDTPVPSSPIYLHCAITPNPLPPIALATQKSLEAEPLLSEAELEKKNKSLLQRARLSSQTALNEEQNAAASAAETSDNLDSTDALASPVEAQPRGFDRLLAPSSGLDAADVHTLRAQFRHVISTRYTPDTMPSPTSLLRMEEAWLDTSSFSAPQTSGPTSSSRSQTADTAAGNLTGIDRALGVMEAGSNGAANGPRGGYTDDDASASLDDRFFGVFIGFFWPLGACLWGLREEGVWSSRRSKAVMAGVLINILFGVVKVLS